MKNIFETSSRRIDKKEDEPFGEAGVGKKEKLKKEDLEQYRKDGQQMIDSYHRFFMTYAKDVSLQFKMSDGFYIDLESGTVNNSTEWFYEKGFSETQIIWANLHELEHFRDLAADPEGVMKNFEYIRAQAKKTGTVMMEKWEEAYGAANQEFIEKLKKQRPISKNDPQKTMNAVEQAAYKIHHTFFNIFDDINDNANVARKAPRYAEDEAGGAEIAKLYREKLFVKTDYSDLPRHLQFLYKLLREEMVKDEEVSLSGEVAEVMQKKIKFQGKEYTPKEIVDEFIKPKGGRETRASRRHFILQKTLEPVFAELLIKDLEEWKPQKPEEQEGGEGKPQEGDANPFAADYDDFDKNSPDQINAEDVENWIDKHKEDKKEEEKQKAAKQKEESKTAEEKAGEAQEKMDKNWCEKNGVKLETLLQYRKIEQEVSPYLDELSRLWQRIIFGSSKKIERGMEGHFKTGAELDIGKAIEEWPKIQKGQLEEARVMKKMTQKEILIKKPELIRVRLVGDMSGSMNEEKKHILQQCVVLLLSSLREFNTYLNLTRRETKSKLEVDTEVWIFGNAAERIKHLRRGVNYSDEQAEEVQIFEKLQNTLGGTYDNAALQAIFNSFSPDDKEKIQQGKIMEITLVVTDGGSSAPDLARQAVDNLFENKENRVLGGAFQIGKTSDEEKKIFNQVWNDGREKPLGAIVGKNIDNLLPAVTELLKKYLGNVKL